MASTDFTFFYGLKQQDSYERCGSEVKEYAEDHVNLEDKSESLMKLQSAGWGRNDHFNSTVFSGPEVLTQMKNGGVRLPTTFDVSSGALGSRPAGERLNPSSHAPSPSRDCELRQMSQNRLPKLPNRPDGPRGPFQQLHNQVAETKHEFTKLKQENAELKERNIASNQHKALLEND
ncbi:hypothetical protein CABS02_14790 [Colletotrichum abscissum]|uniref:Uncharacterized protein n=1 Tax=Colletotrichum abscissum TaxID=1671311 RepID=A0A9Q0AVT6_9PEZI|nr:hypothetical protein CABS02_14790 [Colletotrichum abscissum]